MSNLENIVIEKNPTYVKYEDMVIKPILHILDDNIDTMSKSQIIKSLSITNILYNVGNLAYGRSGTLHYFFRYCTGVKMVYDPLFSILLDSIKIQYNNIPSHYINRYENSTYATFKALVESNIKFEQWELDQIKTNNTCDEWVKILVAESGNHDSEYHINDMLFLTPNDFYWQNGYLVRKISQYGLWQNVELPQSIQSHFNSLLENEIVKKSFEQSIKNIKEIYEGESENVVNTKTATEIMRGKLYKYSLVTDDSLAYTAIKNNAHESYLNALKNICENILDIKQNDKIPESTIHFSMSYLLQIA